MNWPLSLNVTVSIAVAVIASVIAGIAWARRDIMGGNLPAGMMVSTAVWSFATGMFFYVQLLPAQVFWLQLSMVGMICTSVFSFLIALKFSHPYLANKYYVRQIVWFIPFIGFVLVFTNGFHHLVWNYQIELSSAGPILKNFTAGIVFWILNGYYFLMLLAAIVALSRGLWRIRLLYQDFTAIVILLSPLPIFISLFDILWQVPQGGFFGAPLAFTLTGAMVCWSLNRAYHFDLLPVARDVLVENLKDGILVLDHHQRVVDANPAFLQMFNCSWKDVMGRVPQEIIPGFPETILPEQPLHPFWVASPDGKERLLDLYHSSLFVPQGNLTGSLVVFRDITRLKNAEDVEREQRVIAVALRDTAAALNSTLNIEEVLDRILENVGKVVPHDLAEIIMEDENGLMQVKRHHGYIERCLGHLLKDIPTDISKTPTLKIILETKAPLIIPDTSLDARWTRIEGLEWLRSYAGAPICVKGKILGFINLASTAAGFYQADTAGYLMIFADQAGIAIENARLYSRMEKLAIEAAALQQVGTVINLSLDFKQVLDLILEQIGRVVRSDTASIVLLKGDELEMAAVYQLKNGNELIGRRWKLKDVPHERVYRGRCPIIFPDVQVEFESYRVPPHQYIHGLLVVPLLSKDKIIGFLNLDSSTPNYFTEDDQRVASAFATQVVIALENSRLYTESQRRLTEQAILNEVMQSISSKLELNEFLELVYRQVNRFIHAESFFIANYETETDEWQVVYEKNVREKNQFMRMKSSQGATGYVISTRKPLLVNNSREISEFREATGRKRVGVPSKSWMGVPLIVADKVVGAMVAQSYEYENFYSQEDLNLFVMIASQVAVAFENARLFAQVQQLAVTDTLTGLYTRRHFFELAEKEVERAQRYERDLVVAMLDLDHFKNVNDRYGHLIGDQVLRTIALACCQALRKMDFIGRYGGEEFVMMMPDTGIDEALAAAERLRQLIQDMEISTSKGVVKMTCSIGLTALAHTNADLETLLEQADKALYLGKMNGRNQVKVFDPAASPDLQQTHTGGNAASPPPQ